MITVTRDLVRTVKVTIEDDKEMLDLIAKYSPSINIKGKSCCRLNKEDREKTWLADQTCGEAGSLALHLIHFERDVAVDLYIQSKLKKYPKGKGDGGYDIIDTPIDVKNTATMITGYIKDNTRNKPKISSYRLLVAECEMHKNHIYVCALSEIIEPTKYVTHVIGWAHSSDFPLKPEPPESNWAGSFLLRNTTLRKLPVPDVFPQHIKDKLKFDRFHGDPIYDVQL